MNTDEFCKAWGGATDLEARLGLLTENCNMDYVHDAEHHSLALGLSATEGDAEMVEHRKNGQSLFLQIWEGSTADVEAKDNEALLNASYNGHRN